MVFLHSKNGFIYSEKVFISVKKVFLHVKKAGNVTSLGLTGPE